MKSEKIELQGLKNTRDMGGIINKEGKRIKAHKLIRSGALYHGSEADIERLYDEYDVRQVIDMRNDTEMASHPDPLIKDMKLVPLPIFNYTKEGITREDDQEAFFARMIESLKGHTEKIIEFMIDLYDQMSTLEEAKENYHTFVKLLLENKEGSTLWHCSMGKDRCGIGAMIVLNLLDVDEDTIMEDYLYTNDCYDFPKDSPTYYFDTVRREYLEKYLQNAGNLSEYIEKEIGVTKEEKEQFKALYLE